MSMKGPVAKKSSVRLREADLVDADSIAAIHAEGWRQNYAGFLPASAIAARDEHWRRQSWRRKLGREKRGCHTFVVEAADRVVGFAAGGPVRPHEGPIEGAIDGPEERPVTENRAAENRAAENRAAENRAAEIYSLYLAPDWQGRGWGKRLVSALAQRLAQDGAERCFLWCFEDNPNRSFFARLGGEIIASGQVLMADCRPRETAYGWHDIHALIAACEAGANGE
jgi:GNAT superfamily N-acetyltransferase